MATVSSRDLMHNFTRIAARVAAGEELTVTRHGKALLKLVPAEAQVLGQEQRAELVRRALSFRATRAHAKPFERNDAYPLERRVDR